MSDVVISQLRDDPTRVDREAARAALLAAPWCWPDEDEFLSMATAVDIAGNPPSLAVGQAPLLTVTGKGQVSLWSWSRNPQGQTTDLSTTSKAEVRRASRVLTRAIPLLWKPQQAQDLQACRVDTWLEGVGDTGPEPNLDGDSLGLSILLSLASIAWDLPLPEDLAISARIEDTGAVGPVDGLEQKMQGLARMAPRIKRLMVASEQTGDIAELATKLGLELIGVSNAEEAIAAVWDEEAVADKLLAHEEEPDGRRRIVEYLYICANQGRGQIKAWRPIRIAAERALEAWIADLDDDQLQKLRLTQMVALRHSGVRDGDFELPTWEWVDKQPPEARLALYAHMTQQCTDRERPSFSEIRERVEPLLANPPATTNAGKLMGAYGRVCAQNDRREDGLKWQIRAAELQMDSFFMAEATYPLSAAFRVSAALKGARLTEIEALWDRCQLGGDLGGGRHYVLLGYAAALRAVGEFDRAKRLCRELVNNPEIVTHVVCSAIRILAMMEPLPDDIRRIFDGFLALPGDEKQIAETFEALMALDAALDDPLDARVRLDALQSLRPKKVDPLVKTATERGLDIPQYVSENYPY